MFALVVRFDLHDADAAEGFDALLAETLPLIVEREPGTLVYATHRVEDEPLARVFYEVYTDRAAHATHEATAHTARFLAAVAGLAARTRVDFLDAPSGKGTPAGEIDPTEAVPGCVVDADTDLAGQIYQVDGERFSVRDRAGAGDLVEYDYNWLTGPNEGYGFGVSGPDHPSEAGHETRIREFLAAVDPETGYLA